MLVGEKVGNVVSMVDGESIRVELFSNYVASERAFRGRVSCDSSRSVIDPSRPIMPIKQSITDSPSH